MIDAHCENQSNKSKLALYKALFHINSRFKQLYICKRQNTSNVKVDAGCRAYYTH